MLGQETQSIPCIHYTRIKSLVRKFVGLCVLLPRNQPEVHRHAQRRILSNVAGKLLPQIAVLHRRLLGCPPAVLLPLADRVRHRVDQVRRVGLDDQMLDGARRRALFRDFAGPLPALGGELLRLAQCGDRGVQLGSLAGVRMSGDVGHLEGYVLLASVRRVPGAEVDAASRSDGTVRSVTGAGAVDRHDHGVDVTCVPPAGARGRRRAGASRMHEEIVRA